MLPFVFSPFYRLHAEKIRQALRIEWGSWDDLGKTSLIQTGHTIGNLPILFEKVTDEIVQAQMAKLEASKKLSQVISAEPIKENIDFETFQKMDIRLVKILQADYVPKTKKLLKLTVDTGTRQTHRSKWHCRTL
jgi:methionyl-tRNA synthetase